MLRYILKRLGYTFVALYVIVTVTFFLMKAVPGDPFTQEKAVPKEILESMYRHYHLDKPWYVQYGHYLISVVRWDLGPSFKYKSRTVNDIIAKGFPISAALGLEALLIALAGGMLLGVFASLNQGRWQDYVSVMIAVVGISVPSFILAACLQYIFAIKLEVLPVARWGTFAQSILPAVSLAAVPMAFIARLTRSNMVEVLQQDYIKTARAKGVSRSRMTVHHALRNAVVPVLTYLGPLTANILSGSFVVEKIFGIPGLGQWFITSITNRDYPVITGVTVFYSIVLLTAIFVVDLVYGVLDPRMRLRAMN